MRSAIAGFAMLWAVASAQGAGAPPTLPFENEAGTVSTTPLDAFVLAKLQERGLSPANPCSDAVFIRRVYLDTIGTLPDPQSVDKFLADERPDKRARLIDTLLERKEFADYWAMKWCDVLRVKAEFPVNLWPNAVQAYHRWIRDSIREDKPYDEFVRELLTSSGSNFRVPPVNFYRAIQGREPSAIASAVALTFMGTRLDTWPEAERKNMATFFSRVAYKKTAEWKEEIVYLDPAATGPLDVVFPDGVAMQVAAGEDPRRAFANWLIAPDNPWFARNVVNRVWAWLMGRGIIHEPDDIRPDNPPTNPELLAYLEKEFVNAKYDLKHVFRLILNSATYQQSSIPQGENPDAATLFACYPVRRLEAEVLIDALAWISGTGEGYQSPIPEPYTFIPEYERAIALADGSITSPSLEMFGRPARDTGLESERNNQPTDAQRLYLLNSRDVRDRIQKSWRLRKAMETGKDDPIKALQAMYLTILSRYPTQAEVDSATEYLKTSGLKPKETAADLAWALINTKEFLYRH